MIGRDGAVLKEENGKPQYKPAVVWRDRRFAKIFSDHVINFICAECPQMLTEGGAQ